MSDPSSPLTSHIPGQNLEEKTIHSEVVFRGIIATVKVDKALHPSGATVRREVVEHPGGVVVCPILDDGRIIFVRQWRYPLGHLLLELPAGKLDWTDGIPEEPGLAIQRELMEETGYHATSWEQLTYIYTAPGFCNEKIWLYKATGLFTDERTAHPDDDEWLDIILLTPQQAFDKIKNREIVDAKTVTLLSLCFFQPEF